MAPGDAGGVNVHDILVVLVHVDPVLRALRARVGRALEDILHVPITREVEPLAIHDDRPVRMVVDVRMLRLLRSETREAEQHDPHDRPRQK